MQVARSEGRNLVSVLALLVMILALFGTFALAIYISTIILPPPATNEEALFRSTLLTGIGLVLGLISVWLMGRAIDHASRPIIGSARAALLRRAVTYILYAAVIIAALSHLQDISGYLVSLGIVAIILGLAAQTVIGNLLSGMIVFAGRPFRVGDYVRVGLAAGPVEGRVVDVGFLKCKVETNDAIVTSVPNNLLLSSSVANYSVHPLRPLRVAVVVEKEEDEEKLREVATSKLPAMLEEKPIVKVYVNGYDAEGYHMEVWVNVRTSRFLTERSAIIQSLRRLSDKSKIPLKKISIIQ